MVRTARRGASHTDESGRALFHAARRRSCCVIVHTIRVPVVRHAGLDAGRTGVGARLGASRGLL